MAEAKSKLLQGITSKTIQPSFLYEVDIVSDKGETITPDSIISVKIPTYELTKNTYKQGSIPVYFLTFDPESTLDLTITCVENMGYYADGGVTKQGSIRSFIHQQLKRVINSNGYHYAPLQYINKKVPITVKIKDYNGDTLSTIYFKKWAYVGGQQSQDFSYGSEEALTYELTFTFEEYEIVTEEKSVKIA